MAERSASRCTIRALLAGLELDELTLAELPEHAASRALRRALACRPAGSIEAAPGEASEPMGARLTTH